MLTIDPVARAERWLAPVHLETTSVVFVIGVGEGYVLDALDRRGWPGHVVALELDPLAAAECMARESARRWENAARLTVLAGPDYVGLETAIASLPLTTAKPVIVGNPAVAGSHREECVGAARAVGRAWFGARANEEARKQNAGRYLLNTLRNVPAMGAEGSAATLVDAFTGIPAVIIAAGPSLDRNLAGIASVRSRALLIAVDTALRPLLSVGVQPDFVVAVDPSEANASHLTDLPLCPETSLVAEGSIDPEALAHFAGRIFFFRIANHHPWPWLRDLGIDCQPLRAWGSVLTTAFDLALRMGCDPIVFTGGDLSYTDGRPYARGTTYEEEWRREAAWGQSVEQTWATRLAEWPEVFEKGVSGQPVRTAPHLRSFRDWIVTEADRASGRRIVNATEGGILAGAGVVQSSLVAALDGQSPMSTATRQSIAALRVAGHAGVTLPSITDAVCDEWVRFSGVSAEAIAEVLRPGRRSVVATGVNTPQDGPASFRGSLHPGLSGPDADYLRELAETETIRLVVLGDPAQDLLADLQRQAHDIRPNEALVIVDDVGIGAGAQVRRAVDAILCERQDLWLEYRRFVDHASRLTVLRGCAAMRTPPPSEADAAKWDAEHQAVADSLAPLIVAQLAPESAVDLGCGAGFWLKALADNGVADVHGITSRPDGVAVIANIVHAPLSAVPDMGRRFDVCLCLETVQRLSPKEQGALVEACTRLSDVVVFSSTPPGVPGSSPHDRPLSHWAEKFWRCGYLLDDSLRPLLQARYDSPRTVFDGLVTFRRQASRHDIGALDAAVRSAARIHELYVQAIWWSALASDRRVETAPTIAAPRSRLQAWRIPPSRMLAATGAIRLFRFRTDAARWYVTHPESSVEVSEDGRPLRQVTDVDALAAADSGGWVRWRDEISVRASDGTDPRHNGRRYTVRLPTHVAWAESRPLGDTLSQGL